MSEIESLGCVSLGFEQLGWLVDDEQSGHPCRPVEFTEDSCRSSDLARIEMDELSIMSAG